MEWVGTFSSMLAWYALLEKWAWCVCVCVLQPVSAFGVFAAIAILLNYIFVITFTPSLLILKLRHIDTIKICACGKPKDTAYSTSTPKIGSQKRKWTISASGKISRYFTGAMLRKVWGIQLLPITLIVTLTGLGAWGIATAATMTPPTSEEKWFPDDHMITGIRSVGQTYLAGRDDDYEKFQIVFGIKGVDRSAFSRWLRMNCI